MRHSTIIGISVIAMFLIGLQVWNARRPVPTAQPALPPLTRNLPADVDKADLTFKKRIRQRFPVGTREDLIVMKLRTEKFQVRTDKDGRREAYFEQTRYPCKEMWRVFWRVDAASKLYDINAIYGLGCP